MEATPQIANDVEGYRFNRCLVVISYREVWPERAGVTSSLALSPRYLSRHDSVLADVVTAARGPEPKFLGHFAGEDCLRRGSRGKVGWLSATKTPAILVLPWFIGRCAEVLCKVFTRAAGACWWLVPAFVVCGQRAPSNHALRASVPGSRIVQW